VLVSAHRMPGAGSPISIATAKPARGRSRSRQDEPHDRDCAAFAAEGCGHVPGTSPGPARGWPMPRPSRVSLARSSPRRGGAEARRRHGTSIAATARTARSTHRIEAPMRPTAWPGRQLNHEQNILLLLVARTFHARLRRDRRSRWHDASWWGAHRRHRCQRVGGGPQQRGLLHQQFGLCGEQRLLPLSRRNVLGARDLRHSPRHLSTDLRAGLRLRRAHVLERLRRRAERRQRRS